MAEMLAPLDGVAYVARGATNNAGNIFQLRKMLRSAFQAQADGIGFSYVEILTMCPTGWFLQTGEAPDYLADTLQGYHKLGIIKDIAGDAPA
jgi:2-oxoglutarate ferredoxin oxidoreductase subunit beta